MKMKMKVKDKELRKFAEGVQRKWDKGEIDYKTSPFFGMRSKDMGTFRCNGGANGKKCV